MATCRKMPWKLLIDRDKPRADLRDKTGVSPATPAGAFALRAVEFTANQMPVSPSGVDVAAGVESDAHDPSRRGTSGGNEWTTNVVSLTLAQKAKVLGDGIPALSFAAGANPFGPDTGISNLNMTDYARDWPRDQGEWRHSDIVNVAYQHLSGLFDEIVNSERNAENEN